MAGFTESNAKKLRDLYNGSEDNKAVFDWFASKKYDSVQTKVEYLSNVTHVHRAEVIKLLKELAELRMGEFKIGRRGSSTRMEWSVVVPLLGKVAQGVEKIEALNSEPKEEDNEPEDVEDVKMNFQIRRNKFIPVQVPADMTPAEANRLAEFIKTLAVDDAEDVG